MEKLLFAQKFPFSETAREELKTLDIQVDKIPEGAIKKSALMVSRAVSGALYTIDSSNPSKDFLQTEVMAFPVAKMFVSIMKTPNMIEKFSFFIYKNTFNNLVEDSDPNNLCLQLADDFKIKYSVLSEKDSFVSVPLNEYLKIYFVDEETKLQNKALEKGKVFLNLNDFARFLAEKAYAKVFESLPIKKESVPKDLLVLGKSLDSQLVVREKKEFDLKLAGKMDPMLFPPCMKVLYADQLAGKKLHYMARLSLAAFLYQLGMPKSEMMVLFAKSPDFKKEVAEYHINRIFEKQLSAPGCKKLYEYGLRVSECEKECTFKHPVQYYISKLRIQNRMKNKVSNGSAKK